MPAASQPAMPGMPACKYADVTANWQTSKLMQCIFFSQIGPPASQ